MTTPQKPRANYSMEFKLAMVKKSLQPGVSVALLARNNDINDNLLFKWRRRYRHLLVNDRGPEDDVVATCEAIVPVVIQPSPPPVGHNSIGIDMYAGHVAGYEQEISRLKAQLDKLRRMLFGQRSEKNRHKLEKKISQAEKRLVELETRLNAAKSCLDAEPVVPDADITSETLAEKPAPAERSSSRKPLPTTLPRETRQLLPVETVCPVCNGELKAIGEAVSEQLEIINTAFTVIETVRPKLTCRGCDAILQAQMPAKPLDRSYPGPGLLARILVGKYCEHSPLYRQSEIYARRGVELSRNTMVRWVAAMAENLRPLYAALNDYVLMPGKVHADYTPVKVLSLGDGKTRTGRLWVYVRDDRNVVSDMPAAVWFAYSADRKGEHPQRHLSE